MSENLTNYLSLPAGWEITRQQGNGPFEEFYLSNPRNEVSRYWVSQRDVVAESQRKMEQKVRDWVWKTIQSYSEETDESAS